MFLNELSDKIWATKNARFTAYRRMKRNRVSSNVALSLLSVQIIAINLLVFTDYFKIYSNSITIITIILSTFILVLSLLINQLQYESREKNYHNCGIDLDILNQKIKLRIEDEAPINLDENKDTLNEYSQILQKYSLNHTEFDHLWSTKMDRTWVNRCILYLRWYIFDMNTFYWFMSLLIPFASILIILYVSVYIKTGQVIEFQKIVVLFHCIKR